MIVVKMELDNNEHEEIVKKDIEKWVQVTKYPMKYSVSITTGTIDAIKINDEENELYAKLTATFDDKKQFELLNELLDLGE